MKKIVDSRQKAKHSKRNMADKETTKRFEDLVVWQKGHRLVIEIYKITGAFPSGEKFALISQMWRSAISVPANIAEGFKRRSKKTKVNFYNTAQSFLGELRYYVNLSKDLGYVKNILPLKGEIEELSKMLQSLISKIVKVPLPEVNK